MEPPKSTGKPQDSSRRPAKCVNKMSGTKPDITASRLGRISVRQQDLAIKKHVPLVIFGGCVCRNQHLKIIYKVFISIISLFCELSFLCHNLVILEVLLKDCAPENHDLSFSQP